MGRCQKVNCHFKTVNIIGDCHYCDGHFCGSHRLPEDHNCPKLDECRKVHFERNARRLMKEASAAK